jgi:hypothetical protein
MRRDATECQTPAVTLRGLPIRNPISLPSSAQLVAFAAIRFGDVRLGRSRDGPRVSRAVSLRFLSFRDVIGGVAA